MRRGRRGPIALEYHFDETWFTLGSNLLSVVLYMFLHMAVRVFGSGVTAPPGLVERLKKASVVADLVGTTLRTHRREYLPVLVEDIDDLFRIVEVADAGGKWREAWAKVRLVRTLTRYLAAMEKKGLQLAQSQFVTQG